METKKLIITIFGATGDLVARKILPSIKQLINEKLLPEETAILALGRRVFDTEKYLQYVSEKNADFDGEVLKKYLGYLQMDIAKPHDYLILKNALKQQADTNTVFVHFLALSQELTLMVSNELNKAEIIKKSDTKHRVVVEKPFGSNVKSAIKLKKDFWKILDENQLYRIDHYLGKEMVKKIPELLFSNEQVSNFLKDEELVRLSVIALEKNGILERGEYYDKAGATKDMFQNHLLQLVSLALMDKATCEECDEFIAEKVKVVKSLNLEKNKTVFGQYTNYFKEKNVSAFSKTETLLYLSLTSKKKSLKNIKIDVFTAKKADNQLTELIFEYTNNKKLQINMYPRKEVLLIENEKSLKVLECKEVLMPYGRLILDAYKAEKRYFVRFDEIEAAWQVADQVLKHKSKLVQYNSNEEIKEILKSVSSENVLKSL